MDKQRQFEAIEKFITSLNSQIGGIRSLASEMDSEALEYVAWQIETALYLLHGEFNAISDELRKEGYFSK